MYDTAVPVVVLKIGRYIYHAGGLGLIRSLGRTGVSVYGVHEDRFTPAALSKYLCGRFIWPTSAADLTGVLEGIEAIGKHLGKPAILIPTDDVAAILIAENASTLSHRFLFPRQPPDLPRKLADKAQLYRLCRELNVACAQAFLPQSAGDLERFLERAAFPVVVKRTQPWRPGGRGLRGTEIVQTPERVMEIFRGNVAQQHSDLMLQEYIPDECGEDWIFHGYADERSECLASFTGVKHRSYPAYAGITTYGCSVDNERLRAEAEGLIKALSYRGIMDMDYRFDSRDGRYKLLDFNPRVGAQFRMFQDERGIDVARALHLDLTGRAVPKRVRTQSRSFIVECFDLPAAVRYLRAGDLTLRQWGGTLKSIDEAAFFARDDLLPFFAMMVRFIGHGALRSLGIRREGRRQGTPHYLQGRGHQAPSGNN
jgi:predicted ATP-grasp superfamily ATP-dependent carboligase